MATRPMAYCNPVLVVANAVAFCPIELGHFDLIAVTDGAAVEILSVPTGHVLQALDHGLGAKLRCSSRWSVHPEGRESPQEGPEGVREG